MKRYGGITAVAGVDLHVNAGDVYGYLGPERRRQDHLAADDAGPDQPHRRERAAVRPRPDRDRPCARGRRGVRRGADVLPVPERAPEPRAAGGVRRRRRKGRIDRSLELVELADRAGDRVGGYSHGMRQRLGIAAALLRDPKLLLLDEPTTGLDPGGMRDMRELIRRLAGEGITIVLSSHLLTEVEEVCNRVAIVRSGKIVYEGEIAELKGASATRTRSRRRTTSGRSRCAGPSRGSPTCDGRAAAEPDHVHGRCEGRRRAVRRAGRGGGADPRADPADREPRGAVLLADRGRGRRRAARGEAPLGEGEPLEAAR